MTKDERRLALFRQARQNIAYRTDPSDRTQWYVYLGNDTWVGTVDEIDTEITRLSLRVQCAVEEL